MMLLIWRGKRINAVVAELRRTEAINQVIVGLRVLEFGMRLYAVVDAYVAKHGSAVEATSGAQTQDNSQAALAQPEDGTVGRTDGASPEETPPTTTSPQSAAQPVTDDAVASDDISPRMLSDREKIFRAATIVERLRSDPNRDNPRQNELGPDEIAAIEIIPLLGGMPETEADKLAKALRDEDDDIAWDLLTGFIEEVWGGDDPADIGLPAPVEAFFTTSRPSVTAPGGILDRESRLSITQQLLNEVWYRMETRNERDFPGETVEGSRLRLPPAPPTGPVLRSSSRACIDADAC